MPLFGLMAAGFVAGRARWLSGEQVKGLSFFVFNLAVPALLFRTLGRGDIMAALDLRFLGVFFAGTFLVMVSAGIVGRFVFALAREDIPVMALGAAYPNIVLLGIPLIYALFGEAGLLPVTMIVSVHSLILLPLTIVLIELARGAGSIGRAWRPVLDGVFKNPVILSILAGIAFNLTGLDMPGPVDGFTRLLGGASAPCALFALGATLSAYRLGGDLRESLSMVAFKLVLHPFLVWLLATQIFELPPLWVVVATITAALPTGVNVFIIAQRYEIYLARTTAAVLISSAVSVATITALVLWFGAAQ